MINLIAKSLWNRKGTALLTLFSIAISVALLIGVEQIRKGVRTSFSSAVSGTDLIVGARGGSLQLLLYSVFRDGQRSQQSHLGELPGFQKTFTGPLDHPVFSGRFTPWLSGIGDESRLFQTVPIRESATPEILRRKTFFRSLRCRAWLRSGPQTEVPIE